MNAPKTPQSVLGYKNRCVNFIPCPLCYGCRNYNSIDPNCSKCNENKKQNICNTDLHREDLISKFITKNVITIDEKIDFKDNE